MRAVRIHEHGGPEVHRLEDVPTPEPGPGEALVRIAASGLNFIDVYHRTGRYPRELPFTLGLEASGTVEAVGPGVTEVAVGDRVASAMISGSHAELALVPVPQLVAVPDGVELDTAAAVMLQGMTAHYLTTSTVPLAPGHRVLVHAAAGGVGLLLTQVAKRQGATVYGTVSTKEKAQLAADAGADEVIIYTERDFTDAVIDLTGEGVDVVYDSVGKDTFDGSLQALRPRGHMVLYGQSSGSVEPLDPQRLAAGGSLYLTRPLLAHYTATREELTWRAGELLTWIEEGSLTVHIGERHPLSDVVTAYERLEGRHTTGKVLLIP